ncbi:S8 family serine peptidase [Helicobacter sp. 23-1044]
MKRMKKSIISACVLFSLTSALFAESAYTLRKRPSTAPSATKSAQTRQAPQRVQRTTPKATQNTQNQSMRLRRNAQNLNTKTTPKTQNLRITNTQNPPSTSTQNLRTATQNTRATRSLSNAISTTKGASASTITWSSIGGTALAGGVGGGIYALVKPDEKKDSATSTSAPNPTPLPFYNPPKVRLGVVDSGYNPNQIAQPDKNFYNVGGGGQNEPSHGTNVAKSIRAHNAESEMYMYSARCGKNGICPTNAMYQNLYKNDVRIINGSWGAMVNTGGTNTPVGTLNYYYTNHFYYNMAKEAANNNRIFVFAAGNQSSRHANMQSTMPYVVNATRNHANFDRKVWENSRRGWVAVTATARWNNLLDTRYANWIGEEAKNWGIAVAPHNVGIGTSYSAPVITGMLGNIWNQFPWMDNHLVTQTLFTTADKYTINNTNNYKGGGDKWHKGVVTDGPNKKVGWGVANQARALKGPARFDTRLLVSSDNGKVQVNFEWQNYENLNQVTFGNDIAGDAGLHKLGSGALYMSGKNTYTGETHIDDGTIILSNALTNSKVTINTQGALFTQNLAFLPSGTTQPNSVTLGTQNSGYTLTNYGYFGVLKDTTLNGDYISKGNASTLGLDVDAKLDVKGSVDMSGGKFAFHSLSTIPSSSYQTKTLLTANAVNNWNEKWSVASDSSAFLRVSGAKINDNKNLSVTYRRDSTNGVLTRAMGYAPQNLQNVGQGIDAVFNKLSRKKRSLDSAEDSAKVAQIAESTEFAESSAVIDAESEIDFYNEALALLSIPLNQAEQAVTSTSGEIYDSNLSITHKSAMLLNRTIARRLYQIHDSKKSGIWADIAYARSTLQGDGFASGKITQYAIMTGLDGIYDAKNSAFGGGVIFSVDRARGDFGAAGNSDMLSYALSLYGLVSYEDFYMLARAGAGLHDTSVMRKLLFGSNANLQNKQKDMSYHGYIEMGYNFNAGFFRLTPFIAWEEDFLTRKKVQENGTNGSNSSFALTIDAAKYRVSSAIYGAKGFLKFGEFKLEYSALNMYAPTQNRFLSKASFSGNGGSQFTSGGIPQAKNLAFVSLGASYAFSNLILRGEYSLSINPDTKRKIEDEIINLNLRYGF